MLVNRSPMTLALAVGATLLSLGGSAWCIGMQTHYARVLPRNDEAVVSTAPELLPAGAKPVRPRSITPDLRAKVAVALWRNPLDQKLGNLVYLDKVQHNRPEVEVERQARLLAATGWRYNAAQYNLLMRAAQTNDFVGVIDRAEGLLRRQRFTPAAIMLLNMMEVYPQTRPMVVAKLLEQPRWRHVYLEALAPEAGAPTIEARIGTIDRLLQRKQNLTRNEMASTLNTLVTTGRNEAAYRLWQRYNGGSDANGLINDSNFAKAARLSAQSAKPFPFDWSFEQNIGFSTQLSDAGLTLSWDGRSAPMFMRQRVPVRSGRRYALRIEGSSDHGTLGRVLMPQIECGDATGRFTLVEDRSDYALYHSDPLSPSCSWGILTISGSVDSGSGNRTLDLRRIVLQPQR